MTHWSNFFNPSKKNYFGCAANHPSADNESLSSLDMFLEVKKESKGAKSGEQARCFRISKVKICKFQVHNGHLVRSSTVLME
jgi:hypothetical protein